MSYITDPANNADNSAYDSVRNLANITSTNAVIDANPLYQAAELYIIGRIPSAADRTYTERAKILLALGFIASSYMLSGASPTQISSDTVKSETIGIVRTEYAVSTSGESKSENRSEFLFSTGDKLLDEILGIDTDTTDTAQVSLTQSKL